MDQVSEDENVQDFYDDDTNGVLDADKAAEDKFSSESTDIITVYLSEADTFELENVEVDDVLSDVYHSEDLECADQGVVEFVKRTCGCLEECSSKFSLDMISQSRTHFRAFDCVKHGINQLDTVMLGIIHAITLVTPSRKRGTKLGQNEKNRLQPQYLVHGLEVCEEFFVFVHGIGMKRFRNLLTRFQENNNTIRDQLRSNPEKLTATGLPHEHIVNFLRNFAEDCTLYFPRRVGSRKRIIKLMPCDVTKIAVHTKYKWAAEQVNDTPVDIYKFSDVWNSLCPDIVVQRMQSETKRAQRKRLKKLLTLQQNVDTETVERRENLFRTIQPEINHYEMVIEKTRNNFPFTSFDVPRPVQSFTGSVHLSFDLAQQVHIPSNPQAPNPALYFLVPYQVKIFGVMNETCKRQCNYIIPEAVTFTKTQTPNTIVSYLHHYLKEYTFGETELYLHGGDCMVRNKNSLIMQYLAWRVARKLNKKITISFLPENHTKFGPDYAFGFFKMKFRQSVISCLKDLVDVVNNSKSNSHVNFSFLVGDEGGKLFMDFHDWQAGFADAGFSKIPDITTYSHFYFDESWLGKVKCQKGIQLETTEHEIFDSTVDVSAMNFVALESGGMPSQRKLYLYEKIRPHCTESTKNILCPPPATEIKAKSSRKRKLKPEQ